MKDVSHLKLIAMSLLQTCGYVTEQMKTDVTIDVNKFMESFSIKKDNGLIHPPSWTLHEGDLVTISTSIPSPVLPVSQTDSPGASSKPFNMDDYRRCRQAEAIRWINLQEKRASIIARLQPVTPEAYKARRDAVNSESGPLRRKDKKPTGL